MTKPTPGPYLREGTFVYALTENTSESARSRKNTPLVNRFTAQVYGGGRDGAPIEELEAVARLFEAAPDLLAACEEVLEYWESDLSGFAECEPGCDCVVDRVRAAIAKARGTA